MSVLRSVAEVLEDRTVVLGNPGRVVLMPEATITRDGSNR